MQDYRNGKTNILVATIDEPFSYQVPYSRFATTWQVLGMRGYTLAQLSKQPLADNIPQGYDSVRTGRRDFQWRDDQGHPGNGQHIGQQAHQRHRSDKKQSQNIKQ